MHRVTPFPPPPLPLTLPATRLSSRHLVSGPIPLTAQSDISAKGLALAVGKDVNSAGPSPRTSGNGSRGQAPGRQRYLYGHYRTTARNPADETVGAWLIRLGSGRSEMLGGEIGRAHV